ncbi:MAG: hypothetical protein JXQ75_20115 [Phycisphaerae bacterium]|nr:hypothetical protein [Phycisphaerae bacterium]
MSCSSGRMSSSTRLCDTICSGDLDECRQVELSCDMVRYCEDMKPAREYEQLTLKVSPREHLRFKGAVKTIDLDFGVPRGQLRFQDVEARTDEARQKVWFVERATGRVLATLDLATRMTTGPDDEPPAWATPDGGLLLVSSSD